MTLEFTLLSDGSSDQALLPIIRWVLRQYVAPSRLVGDGQWADLRRFRAPPRPLAARMAMAIRFFPCSILFVHRDAESSDASPRFAEIGRAWAAMVNAGTVRHVPVVPIQMTEAWLLVDERAIRAAAGNAGGECPLELPDIRAIESLADPKAALFTLLRDACGLQGRRRDRFKTDWARSRVPDFMDGFGRLRHLAGFRRFESDVQSLCAEPGWAAQPADQPDGP